MVDPDWTFYRASLRQIREQYVDLETGNNFERLYLIARCADEQRRRPRLLSCLAQLILRHLFNSIFTPMARVPRIADSKNVVSLSIFRDDSSCAWYTAPLMFVPESSLSDERQFVMWSGWHSTNHRYFQPFRCNRSPRYSSTPAYRMCHHIGSISPDVWAFIKLLLDSFNRGRSDWLVIAQAEHKSSWQRNDCKMIIKSHFSIIYDSF